MATGGPTPLTVDVGSDGASAVATTWRELFSSWERPVTFASLVAALLAEFAELVADAATWRFDILNWLELPSLLLAAAGTTIGMMGGSPLLEQQLVVRPGRIRTDADNTHTSTALQT